MTKINLENAIISNKEMQICVIITIIYTIIWIIMTYDNYNIYTLIILLFVFLPVILILVANSIILKIKNKKIIKILKVITRIVSYSLLFLFGICTLLLAFIDIMLSVDYLHNILFENVSIQ